MEGCSQYPAACCRQAGLEGAHRFCGWCTLRGLRLSGRSQGSKVRASNTVSERNEVMKLLLLHVRAVIDTKMYIFAEQVNSDRREGIFFLEVLVKHRALDSIQQ